MAAHTLTHLPISINLRDLLEPAAVLSVSAALAVHLCTNRLYHCRKQKRLLPFPALRFTTAGEAQISQ